MKQNPKIVQIFLAEGTFSGVRTAEIPTKIGQIIALPRNKIRNSESIPTIHNAGVYFLFGVNEESNGEPQIYIGKASDCLNRIKQHDQNKNFWQDVVIFTSQSNNFSHIIDALEWKCLIEAKDARRYSLVNNVSPSHPFLSVIDIFQNSDRRTKVVEGGRDERETTSQIPQACSFK